MNGKKILFGFALAMIIGFAATTVSADSFSIERINSEIASHVFQQNATYADLHPHFFIVNQHPFVAPQQTQAVFSASYGQPVYPATSAPTPSPTLAPIQAPAPTPTPSPNVDTIHVSITHIGGYSPSTITVNQGDTVRILATTEPGTQNHGHGITISQFGVNAMVTSTNLANPTVIQFVASQSGNFSITCGTCSQGIHFQAGGQAFTGTLIVNPRNAAANSSTNSATASPASSSLVSSPTRYMTNSNLYTTTYYSTSYPY